MNLADQLEEWTDLDVAQYELGRTLGWFAGQSFRDVKHVFWTDNPVGTALYEVLQVLTEAGMLEYRDGPTDNQFRWNPAVHREDVTSKR